MAVPVLPLNLAPRPSLWRQRHLLIGWVSLAVGGLILIGAGGLTWRAYHQASRAGREAVSLTEEAKRAARQEQQLQTSLQDMDATREQSRWKLAERILLERSLPWSRLTAELEQCMVPDMRLKGLQRTRANSQQVVMKLKVEARTREAESAFIEALRATPVFAQVVLERESERLGGGWDVEITLPTAPVPPPFQVKAIKLGPATAASPAKAAPPARPVAVPAPRAAVTAPTRPTQLAPPQTAPPLQGTADGLQNRTVTPPANPYDERTRPHRPTRIRPAGDPRTSE
ncbi:hypothetical protein [Geothrix sp. PMB-07]|uniref:hypothetical protein n=1 Tax=Geothrix sp. PMB-07 TaxID=3068640 RepID=UPI002741A6E9|nr:hypothetical protein [Geothrix sp. PMB-07]WLT33005.1 hypothetical protein Q9293_06670 [Geothrix sp. PMB-07]